MGILAFAAALQAPVPRDGLAVAADVAMVVVAVAVIVSVIALTLVLLKLMRVMGEVRLGVRQNFGPVSDRARSISDNVEFITEALRSDVQRLNASVRALSDRLQQASDHMEQRIEDFNALMEVVQGEAEDIFLDTAAVAHGVREGARSISSAGKDLGDSRTPDDETTDGSVSADSPSVAER